MFIRILGCVIAMAVVVQSAVEWHVIRQLAANEICVNSTVPMGGNRMCAEAPFPIVNSTFNFGGVDKLMMLNAMSGQTMTPCLTGVVRMSCIKETEVCSTDKRYAITITQEVCLHYMECLPTAQFPPNMKGVACSSLPLSNATIVPGPMYEILPQKKETESASACLQQSFLTIAAIFASVTYMF